MTREEIIEGIEQTICGHCDNPSFYGKTITLKDCQDVCRERAICAYCTDLTNALLKCEDKLGAVIKGQMLTFEGETVGYKVEPLEG